MAQRKNFPGRKADRKAEAEERAKQPRDLKKLVELKLLGEKELGKILKRLKRLGKK